ncbi:MAG: extradiol ring-cleavage dioxygenase [Candidatus Binatia bacterium]
MGTVVGALIVTHTPRIADESKAPAFTREMIRGMHELGKEVERLRPDALVQVSTHWVTTFHHYVLGHKRHRGVLTASEAPDMISGVPYDFPGDPELAETVVAKGKERGLPVILSAANYFVLDYGTLNPLLHLTPKFDIPVVPISSCLLADLQECVHWGETIAEGIKQTSKRVMVVASGALSHTLVRGPEKWPSEESQRLDRRFVELMTQGKTEELKSFFPGFAKDVDAEMGGRHLAILLGATGGVFRGRLHAYGPSSGTGNAVVSLEPA